MSKNAREIAIKVLNEVNGKGAYSNVSIRRNTDNTMSTLDERFVRELVYGVIENKLYIDWIIKKFSKVKFKKIAPMVKEILRIGVYQIIYLEKTPDSAVVNESVKLAKRYSHKGVHGFVNGVLRSVSRNKDNIELPNKEKNLVSYLSIKYSHPEWLIERWIDEYGVCFTEELCNTNNEKPLLNIRVNTLKINREELVKRLSEQGFELEKTTYSNDGIIVKNPVRITETEEFKKGYFHIQDESSMLVAQIMNPTEGSIVIDVCSAPGGKTTHIAQQMNNNGKIIARDIYKHKLKLVQENVERLGINIIKTEVFNATDIDEELIEKADYCLVDAPCSGLGLIRRKPEIKWNKTEEKLNEIIDLQYKILQTSSKYVKSDGILVYSTCTIEKEENIELIKRFLQENKEFKLVGFNELLDEEIFETTKQGFVEIYPNIHGMDGFFIAKMARI